jgi:predicted ATPase
MVLDREQQLDTRQTLLDRDDELETIERLLEAARDGFSGALVLRGEPGIGKTALLDAAVSSAGHLQVIRVLGIESEIELGFAALHQLLIPVLPRLERLPAPQRAALRSAFGLIDGGSPDRFLVSLAVLSLIAATAAAWPLLYVIDDAQWLDQESAEVLAFVARRLHADRVAMLFGTREAAGRGAPLEGLANLDLIGLADSNARELFCTVADGPVHDRGAQRVVAESRGNPLAIVELAAELSEAQLAGAAVLPDPLPVGEPSSTAISARGTVQRPLPAPMRRWRLSSSARPSERRRTEAMRRMRRFWRALRR